MQNTTNEKVMMPYTTMYGEMSCTISLTILHTVELLSTAFSSKIVELSTMTISLDRLAEICCTVQRARQIKEQQICITSWQHADASSGQACAVLKIISHIENYPEIREVPAT
jgi:hypothetical protein